MPAFLKPFLFWCCYTLFFIPAYADVKLPQLISNSMVLQRDVPLKIWGWADAGENVSVEWAGKKYNALAGVKGNWLITLPAIKASGPFTMNITGKNRISITDIMVGDVWFCSGQSNMVIPMERVKEKYPEEILSANYPEIRNFFVPTVSDVRKVHEDLPTSKWVVTSPATVSPMGAATYFFAKKLYQKYHIPIGIINSSVGGTPAEAWVSADGFKEFEPYTSRLTQFKDSSFFRPLMQTNSPANNRRIVMEDKGITGPLKWYDTSYHPKNWHKFWMPGYWDDQGTKNLHGVLWFRKEIEIPATMTGHPAKLFLGRIIDADEAYVNGIKVGNITYQYPPRRYEIPANLLKAGKNTIVVRVTNTAGKGGFVPDKNYSITDGKEKIDLRGEWYYQVGQVQIPVTINNAIAGFSAQNEPSGLYNTMVAPAVNYAVKGFLWYQGEANSGRAADYSRIMKELITDWRSKWNMGELPFIYAQLPNFMEVVYYPVQSQWAELREQQLQTLSVSNTAMTVNIDLGEWNDIHPLNKKEVGERMVLAALKLAYGESVAHSGPLYRSSEISGNRIIITFNNTGTELISIDGEPLSQFAIAGADKKFVWANARIEGNKVIVWSDEVTDPLYVRYAWADNPEGANLYNKEGLPASPFRTDKPVYNNH